METKDTQIEGLEEIVARVNDGLIERRDHAQLFARQLLDDPGVLFHIPAVKAMQEQRNLALDEQIGLINRIATLEAQLAGRQAKIDALMLEYCPDEMTHGQACRAGRLLPASGCGSSFRIAKAGVGNRWLVTDERLHNVLERMAREIHETVAATPTHPVSANQPDSGKDSADYQRGFRDGYQRRDDEVMGSLPVVAYMREWYANGEVPIKERNDNGRMAWPGKFKFMPVTPNKCLTDDKPLTDHAQATAEIAKRDERVEFWANEASNRADEIEKLEAKLAGVDGLVEALRLAQTSLSSIKNAENPAGTTWQVAGFALRGVDAALSTYEALNC